MPRASHTLLASPLFKPQHSTHPTLSLQEHAEQSYLRAEAIAKMYSLSDMDILTLSPKFWRMHTDPLMGVDGAAATLLTIQLNLAAGTLAPFAMGARKDLYPLYEDMIKYRVYAQFCLTEMGHGLDAIHGETRATLLDDGHFDLHTPNDQAAKYMPPTIPVLGKPCYAVVFAQLYVKGEHRGIRPFVVLLNDGRKMAPGVSARMLPYRGGSNPVNHAITSFAHVRLSPLALLGDIEKPVSLQLNFAHAIWRVGVGAMGLGSCAVPALQVGAYIAFQYSLRRTVLSPKDAPIRIIEFRTQKLPVYGAVASAYVMKAYQEWATERFCDSELDPRVRHGLAAALKATSVALAQGAHLALSERMGAQGLFAVNQIYKNHSEMRGIAIAEGDILVLSIRLATEIILDRYEMPASDDPTSILAQHEAGLIRDARAIVAQFGHRSAQFASHVLPRCQVIVEAIGARMARDAAVPAHVPPALVEIFEAQCVEGDLAWYVENGLVRGRNGLVAMQDRALELAEGRMAEWVEEMDVAEFATAPVVSAEKAREWVDGLDNFDGGSAMSVPLPLGGHKEITARL